MRFTVATVLAFASSTIAVGIEATHGFDSVDTPNKDEQVPAGKAYTVKWTNPAPYVDGQIYIQLLGGKDSNTLQVKTEKLVTLNNNQKEYVWNVDSSLGDDATYGLKFVWEQDDNIVQYSKQFHIKKADDASSGTSTVTTTSSQGVKTVSLSTTSPTTASSATTTPATNTSPSAISTSSTHTNTTTARNNTTTATTLSTAGSVVPTSAGATTTSSTTSSTPSAKPSSGAAAHAAGSVAAIGGLVAALLAL